MRGQTSSAGFRGLEQLALVWLLLLFVGCSTNRGPLEHGGHDHGAREDGGGAPYHTVQRGECLKKIAAHYGTSVRHLTVLNGIRSGRVVEGQRLLVTGAGDRGRLIRSSAYLPPRSGRLYWPVDGGDLVSVFGPRDDSFHDGLDIAAPAGAPIYAAQGGEVVFSGDELGGYGNLVIIRGADGLLTLYGHNKKNLVTEGQRVAKGQRIALVGETGRASGPHLHFEVRLKDAEDRYVAVDPLPLMQSGKLPGLRYRVNESLTPLFAKLGFR